MAMILVADDSWLARQMIVNILKGAGYETEEAVDGKEAFERIQKQPPDLLMLDLLMPELDGFGVLERLRAMGSAVPVVVLTADIQETTRKRCEELGATCVFEKPPEMEQILRKIKEVLNNKGKVES